MTKNIIVSIMTLTIISTTSYGLSQSEFIDKVLENKTLFVSEEIELFLKREMIEVNKQDIYGWIVDTTSTFSMEKSTDDASASTATGRDVSIDASKAFRNGMSLSISLSESFPINEEEQHGHDNSEYFLTTENDGSITTSLDIPLLKGNDGGSDKIDYDEAILDEKIQSLTLINEKEDIVMEALNLYIDLSVNIEKLRVRKQYLFDLQKIKSKYGRHKPKIKKIIAKIKSKILRSETKVKSLIKKVHKKSNIDANVLKSIKFKYRTRIDLVKNIKQYLQKNSIAIKIDNIEVDIERRNLARQKNELLPDLMLSLSNNTTANSSSENDIVYHRNVNTISLDLSYPIWGNSGDEFDMISSQIEFDQMLNENKNDVDDIVDEIEDIEEFLKTNTKSLEIDYQEENDPDKNEDFEKFLANKGDVNSALAELKDNYNDTLEYLADAQEHKKQYVEYNNAIDRLVKNKYIVCYFCQKNKYIQ
jgi:hypothetical protein